jgi:transposase
MSPTAIGMWLKRFTQQGLMAIYDETKPGGRRSITDEQAARLIQKTLNKKPANATHWSCRAVAKDTNLSKSTAHRVWKSFGIQPHRQNTF